MSVFDIVAGIILLLLFLKGLKNGFVIELASLAALVLGLVGAVKFSDLAAQWLSGYFQSQYLSVMAFVLVFVLVVLAVHLVARGIDRLLKAVALGWLNRLVGAFFGLLKGAFLLSALLLLLDAFGLSLWLFSPEIQASSLLYKPLSQFAPRVMEWLNVSIDHLLPALQEAVQAQDVVV